jgi:RND family efflux transporter MFP subunit
MTRALFALDKRGCGALRFAHRRSEPSMEARTVSERPTGAKRMPPAAAHALAALTMLALLAACGPAAEPAAPEIRPVRVVTIEERPGGDTVSLTGTVQAEATVNLAFRIDGRMSERLANVGDTVAPGQLVARLDPENEESALRAARADLAAAMGQLTEAQNNYNRQSTLLRDGWTTKVRYDEARQNLGTTQSRADAAQAQLNIAENQVSYTELFADSAGTVTAVGAEPGEVVQAGRMIVQVARKDGRDAVFDVPARIKDMAPAEPVIEVFLTLDPSVKTVGRVREVAPRADPATGTFEVKVGLTDPPAAMRLGSTVTGRMEVGAAPGIEIPASALTRADRQPAVWIVDPATQTVALRNIEVLRYDPARVIVAQGLAPGDIVVTAGVQALRPGQKVRLLGATS